MRIGAKTLKSEEGPWYGGVWGADTVSGVLGVSSPSSGNRLVDGNKWRSPIEGRGPGGWLRPGKLRGFIPGDLRFKSGHLRGWKNKYSHGTKNSIANSIVTSIYEYAKSKNHHHHHSTNKLTWISFGKLLMGANKNLQWRYPYLL